MSLLSNYDKFKKHLSSGGVFYAFLRGIKYPVFLLRREFERLFFKKERSIIKGKLKIQYLPQRLSIFYDNQPITEASGLSSAINSLGLWLDSSSGKWRLLKITKDSLKIKVSHNNFPISQIWSLKLDDQRSFSWKVDLNIKKPVHIDEICILSALNPRYKTWINNYEQDNFPSFNNQWTDLYIGSKPAYLLGVRFPTAGEYLPAFAIEFDKSNLLPLVKNYSSSSVSFHVIGFRHTEYKSVDKRPAGRSTLLTCRAYIFPDESILDEKIENLRKGSLQKAITEIKTNKPENKIEVLLVNLLSNYDKFKKHLSSGGVFYAFLRGIKYPVFLLRREFERLFFKKERSIIKGKLKIQYLPQRLSIFYDNQPITEASGLSSAINSLGLWLDSSSGKWRLLKITKDSLKIKVSHNNFPISQIWSLKLDDQRSFSWKVDLNIKKPVHIDEICILSALNPRYKTWINNYEQDNFPSFNNQWTDLYIGSKPAYLLGVRFPTAGEYLPAFAIEFDKSNLLPLVKNYSSSSVSFHVIGFRHTEYKSVDKRPAGRSTLLTCRAYIFPDESILDEKIENLRKGSLQKAITEIKTNKPENKIEVLLVNLLSNYDKFKKHLSSGGVFYAFLRGIKYPVFLLRREFERLFFKKERSIIKGKLKIQYLPQRLSIFYDNQPITEASGLSSAINSLGLWLDSSSGKWRLLKITKDSLKIKVSHNNFPISQIWSLKLDDQRSFSWKVDLNIKKPVHIDEICILSALNPRYKTWINNYEQDNFPSFNNQWTDLYIGSKPAYLLGVRFPTAGEYLPAFAIEFDKSNLLPLVKNYSSSSVSFHVIGFRHTEYKSVDKRPAGRSTLLTCRAYIFPDESILDEKIENLRKGSLQKAITEIKTNKPENKIEVLLVNLPWQRENRQGVRAGSRWPHLKDASEGAYLPFPFFLAYATSLLRKNGVNAYIIDAIANQTCEEDFLETVLKRDIDFIVAETSVPSFYDDLKLLKRIAEFGVSVILCGPNYEISKPEFLKEQSFISFVLYGEYELTLLELIKALQQKGKLSDINGLIYNDSGVIKKNLPRAQFDIDILPWPERETLPIYSYLDAPGGMRTPSVQILASRGCPFKCQFCLWPQVIYQGNHYRARKIKDVIDEMEYLVRHKGFKSVYFDDDTFNVGRKRMVDFCNEIRKRGLNRTQWSIMARADLMDEELLLGFKKAGLYSVKYGVESAVQSLVDGIKKDMDLKKAEKMIKFTQKLGIKVHLTFTFGLPGETRQTIQKTIDWAKSMDPFSVQFSILTPFPGTEYYKIMAEKGLIVSDDFSCYDGHSKSVIKLESLSAIDLESAKAYSYKVWEEHLRGRRSLAIEAVKFFRYARNNGFVPAILKASGYLKKLSLSKEYAQEAKKNSPPSNDIMLIQSPPWDIIMPPLGIAYLASNLKKLGYKVKVFDLNIALYNSAVKEYFLWEQKSFDWWVDQEYFAKTWEKIAGITNILIDEALSSAGTKVIGLSVNFAGIKFSSRLIKIIKDKDPNIKIIVGGWATSDEYMISLLPTGLIDCIIVGEGEETLPDVIKALSSGNSKDVPGAIFPNGSKEIFRPRQPIMNLDRISWPTFQEFDLSLYKYNTLPLFTSRGCISQCTFCNDWPFSKPYRARSARNIFNEIAYHVYKNNITKFSFKDLLCNGNLNELGILCNLIERGKLKISWDSQAIARKEMTYEFLSKLKKSGCNTLIYGVESFSNSVLKRMGKIFTTEIIEEVLNNTQKAGIEALVNIIVGFPGESEEDFQETLTAIERNRKYLARISAVSVCLINGRSDLDINYRKYGLVLPEDLRTRAKYWVSADGINTYNLRKNRAERVIELFSKIGLTYDTATI